MYEKVTDEQYEAPKDEREGSITAREHIEDSNDQRSDFEAQ
jgi:hypothetical protein